MSLAFHFTPASSFIFSRLYNGGRLYPITGFRENLEFVYKKDCLQLSALRDRTNQLCCKWRVGFSYAASSYGAASSFNYNVSDYDKECGRMESGGLKMAVSDDSSHASTGSFGHGNSDSRGGGANSGSGSGGLDESADWEGVRWFCWRIFQAWMDYCNSTNLSSPEVALSRVGSILVNIEECLKVMAEPNFSRHLLTLLEPVLLPLCVVLALPCLLLSVAVCAGLLAEVLLLGCVAAALILFWWF